MANQAFNLLGSIVVLAIISVALSKKSNTSQVTKSFFDGFSGSLKAAGNAGR